MDPAARRLAEALADIPGIRLGFLFGTRAKGRARKDSDFDVAVLVTEELASEERGGLIRRLAARLGREVSSERLDIVILNDAPALLRHRVLRDGTLLFQSSPEERVRFSIQTIREYQDGFVRREAFTKRRIQRLKARTNDGGSRDLLEKARGVARLLAKARDPSMK